MNRLTFPRKERLAKRQDYNRVFKTGKRVRMPGALIVVATNTLPYSRLGISVKKKIGKAVKRNRIKRRIRELFRTQKKSLPQGFDIVVIPYKEFINTKWDVQAREFVKALERFKKEAVANNEMGCNRVD